MSIFRIHNRLVSGMGREKGTKQVNGMTFPFSQGVGQLLGILNTNQEHSQLQTCLSIRAAVMTMFCDLCELDDCLNSHLTHTVFCNFTEKTNNLIFILRSQPTTISSKLRLKQFPYNPNPNPFILHKMLSDDGCVFFKYIFYCQNNEIQRKTEIIGYIGY